MATHQTLLLFSFFLLLLSGEVHGRLIDGFRLYHPLKLRKLFVFGDSYVDAGNNNKMFSPPSRLQPYGSTFPGKPSGRYSNGRVFSDYIAEFLGIKSPITYVSRYTSMNRLIYGCNFAYGGTGVFDTFAPEPNMTTQIDFFQQMIKDKIFSKRELQDSVALVSVAGNDYSNYILAHGSTDGIENFIPKVVKQLIVNIKRIHELGVNKIAVDELPPLGCIPRSTIDDGFKKCNDTRNELVDFHNFILDDALLTLNNVSRFDQITKNHTFIPLQLTQAFETVINNNGRLPGTTFDNLLKPCCIGTSPEYSCSDVRGGKKMYTVCDNPKKAFFWDMVHPTDEGWKSVFSLLKDDLAKL